jgi:hypothetical protein
LERAEFLVQPLFAAAIIGLRAGNELDRLEQSARRFAFPHFTKPAPAKRLQEFISRQRLGSSELRERTICTALGGLGRRHGRASGSAVSGCHFHHNSRAQMAWLSENPAVP